jgi:glycosyltransferase involved in cell wall biosynthesis
VRVPSAAVPESAAVAASQVPTPQPLLSVVVPVYNGGDEIVRNVDAIRRAIVHGVPADGLELIVVSDGSIDGSAEQLLESRAESGIRVIHYDRNLGKGYAVKAGALASHGEWVAIVDADLELDPASIPNYMETARNERLDFAIGSKRHPDSDVTYPRSRKVASWCYQQLNRLLFGLDVRDTQVGLKVFSRRVVDDVMPLLLVKQFAFDLELLAVATALGYDRIRELPVKLEYRFTGSALGSASVLRALWDTAAVFYRLRVLRTYQRKRVLVGRTPEQVPWLPLVTVIGPAATLSRLDYPRLDHSGDAGSARGEVLAVVEHGARPAGNWVTAALPFFSDDAVAAVVVPTVAPLNMTLGERAAAAVLESRLGGGSRRSRHFPGNVRNVSDYPAENVVIRRVDYRDARAEGVDCEQLVGWLAARGRRTVYTPDASVSETPRPVFMPHLRGTMRHAQARGAAARRARARSMSPATLLSLLPLAAALVGALLVTAGSGRARSVGLGLVAAYVGLLLVSAGLGGLRFRSLRTGLLTVPALVATQAVYVAGFAIGLLRRR